MRGSEPYTLKIKTLARAGRHVGEVNAHPSAFRPRLKGGRFGHRGVETKQVISGRHGPALTTHPTPSPLPRAP